MATRGLTYTSLAGQPIGFRTAAAAGTNQATATVLQPYSGFAYRVTGANGLNGVKLPVANSGIFIALKNDDAANAAFFAYPSTGGSINGGSANAGYSVGAGSCVWFMGISGTAWIVLAQAGAGSAFGSSSVQSGTVQTVTGLTGVDSQAAGVHQTVFTFAAMPLLVRDAQQGNGVQIFAFPKGATLIMQASGQVAETTTSVLASTLHAGVTYNWGVGTTTQANGTLATTEQDLIPTTNGTSSATINVQAAVSKGTRVATPANFDGHSTAKQAFFNVGIATGTDIDADATTTWNGTVSIIWALDAASV